MARQTFYLTRDQQHPLYKTRMLQAGPIELDASAARLYRKLGVKLRDEAQKRAQAAEAPKAPAETKPAAPAAPAKAKAPARKRTRKAKAKK